MEAERKETEQALAKFSASLADLETAVKPVLSALDDLRTSGNEEDLDAMTRTRLHITLCYTVNSLFCMYLRTQGIDPETHPVMDEITRIQEAFMRMRKVEAGQSADYQAPPNRDRRKHIVKTQKSEAKLSALVFPEERDLLLALMNRANKKRKTTDTPSDGQESSSGSGDSALEDDSFAHVRPTDKDLAEFQAIVRRKEKKAERKEERAKYKELKAQKKLLTKKKRKRRKKSTKSE